MNLSEEEMDVVIQTTRICNWISIAVSAYVIATYGTFKWRYPSSLALYFTMGSFCLPWFVQIGVDFIGLDTLFSSPTLCKIQGEYFYENQNCELIIA